MSVHDDHMPKGWHQIKCALLKEMRTAGNFHLCCETASALFHARLIGEGLAKEFGVDLDNGRQVGHQSEEEGASVKEVRE